jgi:hypothetical protein
MRDHIRGDSVFCTVPVTPWDPSLLFSASQLLWERGDKVPGLYPILA